jgi:prophage endopeptidase
MNPLFDLARRVLPYLAACALIFGVFFLAYRHGVTVTTEHYQAIIAKRDTDQAKALAALKDQALVQEHLHAAAMATVDHNYQEQLKNEISSRDAVIDGLRAGTVRLRQRFICPAASSGSVPTATSSTSSGDTAEGSGLQSADAEFLVRLASEADTVTLQLQACQEVVRNDRAMLP